MRARAAVWLDTSRRTAARVSATDRTARITGRPGICTGESTMARSDSMLARVPPGLRASGISAASAGDSPLRRRASAADRATSSGGFAARTLPFAETSSAIRSVGSSLMAPNCRIMSAPADSMPPCSRNCRTRLACLLKTRNFSSSARLESSSIRMRKKNVPKTSAKTTSKKRTLDRNGRDAATRSSRPIGGASRPVRGATGAYTPARSAAGVGS